MAESTIDLAIRGENVQRLFGWYRSGRFVVNRRYQRKLVWKIEEKRAFIDSIARGYPVPLILIAEYTRDGVTSYEIIDGMQRLNAIFSFIEGDYKTADGQHFDLETMVETKLLLDRGELTQHEPKLPREICSVIAGYPIPLSVYRFENEEQVDDVFRRINSGGKHLSRQELRAAGSLGHFATLVRLLATRLRGDVSGSDLVPLSSMKLLSISNKDLEYGLDAGKIFWVEQGVITKEDLRQSKDEELVADTLAYMLVDPIPASSSEILDGFYGLPISTKENPRNQDLEEAVQKNGVEVLTTEYLAVFDTLRAALDSVSARFSGLILDDASQRVPRYFQVVFLALHTLLFKKRLVLSSPEALAEKLKGLGGRKIDVGGGGGRWSAKDRQENVAAIAAILESAFRARQPDDPALGSWTTELENLLMQSVTEQPAFDFKQGFHRLDNAGGFDDDAFGKSVRALTAMANSGPETVGYLLVGVADRRAHKDRIEKLYGTAAREYGGFYITGVQDEADRYYGGTDDYFKVVLQRLRQQPIPEEAAAQISRGARLVRYYDKAVLVLRVTGGAEPFAYDGAYYERHGSEVKQVPASQYGALFRRFPGA